MTTKHFFILFCSVFLTAEEVYPCQSDQKSQKPDSQISISYWNDNFLLEEWFAGVLPKGKDDFITAGFGFQYLTKNDLKYWIYDFSLILLTNKNKNYRTDLIKFLLSKQQDLAFGSFQMGLGLSARRNFGGSEIQSGYHNLFGYRKLEIPYLHESKFGVIILSKFDYKLVSKTDFNIIGTLEGNYITAAGPAKIKTGIKIQYQYFVSFQLDIGYIYYYKTDRWLKPLFGRGFTWGFLTSKKLKKLTTLAFWFSKGRYGFEDEFHFGLTCKFGLSKM